MLSGIVRFVLWGDHKFGNVFKLNCDRFCGKRSCAINHTAHTRLITVRAAVVQLTSARPSIVRRASRSAENEFESGWRR